MTPHEHKPGEIFVFGSNRAGIHGAGAAMTAFKYYGAVRGRGEGIMGTSYAFPTKETPRKGLSLAEIQEHVSTFLDYALRHRSYQFFVTAIGTGLAGYNARDIAPMFARAPSNCRLPPEWIVIIEEEAKR